MKLIGISCKRDRICIRFTAKLADYIIAPTLSLERDDVTMLTDTWYDEPYCHYTRAVLPKNPESLEEWEVYWELSHRTGVPLTLPGGTLDPTTRPSKFDVLALLMPDAQIPLKDIAEYLFHHLLLCTILHCSSSRRLLFFTFYEDKVPALVFAHIVG